MPAKLHYAFLCDGAMQVHGKWTYQGLFNQIKARAFPAIHPEVVAALCFTGPVGPHVLKVQCTDSSENNIFPENRQPVECREFKANTIIIGIDAIIMPSPGFYSVKFFLDDEATPFGTIDFQAVLLPPPSKPQE